MNRKPWDGYQGYRSIDHDYVQELFEYRAGELYWKHRHVSHFKNYHTWRLWRRRYAETLAGTRPNYLREKKHRRVTIHGTGYYLSRVVWLYHHAKWPDYCWHKDGDRQNCAIENLESLSSEENQERVEHICRAYALRRWSTGEWTRHRRKNIV